MLSIEPAAGAERGSRAVRLGQVLLRQLPRLGGAGAEHVTHHVGDLIHLERDALQRITRHREVRRHGVQSPALGGDDLLQPNQRRDAQLLRVELLLQPELRHCDGHVARREALGGLRITSEILRWTPGHTSRGAGTRRLTCWLTVSRRTSTSASVTTSGAGGSVATDAALSAKTPASAVTSPPAASGSASVFPAAG